MSIISKQCYYFLGDFGHCSWYYSVSVSNISKAYFTTEKYSQSRVDYLSTCTSVLSVLFLILFPIDRMVAEVMRIEVIIS
ncbi:hypothetical protein T11_8690 [Trichinella zimbabwensis]|uniref:Uncharacterized protein n=1 Tax=Trichinella zimbabwensis TaxID=268475 RepID=A0A0V1HGJ4_9BILA|nr:hypothetical protein T11_8690 [Trichinella zimbabwensis]